MDASAPLHQACSDDDVSAIEKLLKEGADIHAYAETARLETPLHVCARTGNLESAKALLNFASQHGVDILLAWDAECKTPLRVAADHQHTEITSLLQAHPFQRRIGHRHYKLESEYPHQETEREEGNE